MIIQIKVGEQVYLKDPESSKLGKKIITSSILLIDELGLEQFTFKKLAEGIGSTEASIYRYFENKHKLLIYLTAWYWSWIEYQILFSTNNIPSPLEKVRIAITVLSKPVLFDPTFLHIDEAALYRVVVSESAKAYLTKAVDADNKEGYFVSYKRLCNLIANLVLEMNSDYKYPHSLISTVIEATHNQRFFSEHLPRLTDFKAGKEEEIVDFLMDLICKTLK
ncbi:MAG: AcrR family transcriptional regulator [Cognaticolwellia sp.]